ncbi:hypothetical protein CARUB_v10007930mg, partial [Capsella rubella]
MDPKKSRISKLESLSQDLLGIIVSKAGAISAKDFHNCILSCKKQRQMTNMFSDANYIQRIIQYFILNDYDIGLRHLGLAANAWK